MKVIRMIKKVYREAYYNRPESYGAKIFEACNDLYYTNGMSLNILKGVMILNHINELRSLGHASKSDFDVLLTKVSIQTGYTTKEILERIEL